jgi:TnpA family transposase
LCCTAGRAAANLNAHYGHEPGFEAYTHLSDRYSPFYTKLIAATASEAAQGDSSPPA